MEELTRVYSLMGHRVHLDGIKDYIAIGFKYYHKDYIVIMLSNMNNDGALVEFQAESWRVTFEG